MEKLWSPWRSQYIESFKDDSKKDECIFCKSLEKDKDSTDNLVIDVGEHTFVVLNLYPYNNGHMMIVPIRHTRELSTLTNEEKLEIFRFLQIGEKALKMVMQPDGFNIGVNLGKSSGAGIDEHLHFHIVPRWNGDTNFMPVLGEVKVISQELLKTRKNLSAAFKKIAEGEN